MLSALNRFVSAAQVSIISQRFLVKTLLNTTIMLWQNQLNEIIEYTYDQCLLRDSYVFKMITGIRSSLTLRWSGEQVQPYGREPLSKKNLNCLFIEYKSSVCNLFLILLSVNQIVLQRLQYFHIQACSSNVTRSHLLCVPILQILI